MNVMDDDALAAFVVAAHRNGYAAADPDTVEGAAGTVLEYEEGPWRYVDRYFGSRAYLGMEVVRRDGRPVWGMHYHGAPTDDAVDHDPLYVFLRDALEEATAADPYRGPDGYADGAYTYRRTIEGDLQRFAGEEWITVDGEVVYRGRFAGGRIE